MVVDEGDDFIGFQKMSLGIYRNSQSIFFFEITCIEKVATTMTISYALVITAEDKGQHTLHGDFDSLLYKSLKVVENFLI